MRTLPDDLSAHLLEDATTLCHAWRVTCRDGMVIGFSEHDVDLLFDNTNFLAASGFSASDLEEGLGLAIDTSEVTGAFSSEAIRNEDVIAGRYDGAAVEVFIVNWRSPAQYLKLSEMEIGEVTLTNQFFQAELRGVAHKLDQPQGRIYSHRCDANLGDSRCGVNINQPAYQGTGLIDAIEGSSRLVVTGLETYPTGFFRHGLLSFVDGANQGINVDIESHARSGQNAKIITWLPLQTLPAIGDQVKLVAGCDKTFATCGADFNNAINFQGFPHMPGADFAYSYADGETNHDGSALYE